MEIPSGPNSRTRLTTDSTKLTTDTISNSRFNTLYMHGPYVYKYSSPVHVYVILLKYSRGCYGKLIH